MEEFVLKTIRETIKKLFRERRGNKWPDIDTGLTVKYICFEGKILNKCLLDW